MPAMPSYSTWQRTFVVLGSFVLVVASLKLAKELMIPLALAAMLAFILQPLVARLQRYGCRRTPAVLLVVCLAFLVLSAVAWFFVAQLQGLYNHWPEYRAAVEKKI